jgi:membrane-associated phospholipid phosphatase
MVLRLWPPIAVAAMLALGWVVRYGPIEVDDWFLRFGQSPARWLLFFSDARVLAVLAAGTLLVGIYQRRRRLSVVAVVSPLVAIALPQLLKPLVDRKNDGVLTYPSGHTTTMVVVLGMIVLAAGAALWSVLVAVVWCILGIVGQSVGYHYFTDTIGALLLGSAIVCVGALALRHEPHRT